jgi:hypothetical protein
LLVALQGGGETILTLNEDLTAMIEYQHAIQYIRNKDVANGNGGGVRYVRQYPSRANCGVDDDKLSWQAFLGTNDKDEAIRIFQNKGFEDIQFDANGKLIVHHVHPGVDDNDNWFNQFDIAGLPHSFLQLANHNNNNGESSSSLPDSIRAKLYRAKWNAVSAMRLRKGDWLVLDNLRVQHGRLPFRDDPEQRTILTVYTE